jgi:hypothetical protein
MKRAFHALLMLFVAALVFTSCKKEKDDPTIEGKWGIYHSTYTSVETGEQPDVDTYDYTTNSEDYKTYEFSADGNFVKSWPNDNDVERGTYRVDGNKLYYKYTGDNDEYMFEFNVTEDELVLTEKYQGNGWSETDVEKYRRL